ncbi:MAG TPA: thioredoxin family protein [Dehalococcoidia bacterium]|nr:thioredoxin family protein [Dehalococcoidia bacterium]
MSKISLEIYVEQGCFACQRSLQIAEQIQKNFPNVEVRTVDISHDGGTYSHLVTATPTFVLNGRVFSLGNPDAEDLEEAILGLMTRDDS